MNLDEKLVFQAFDTFCSIRTGCNSTSKMLLNDAEHAVLAIEKKLNMFSPNSELSKFCALPHGNYHKISHILFKFLERNLNVCEMTNGRFDFTVGPLIKLWNFLGDNKQPVSADMIADTLSKIGYQFVHLDNATDSAMLEISGMQLDPGGGGKGFALGIASEILRQGGVEWAVMNFGGNLFVIGGKPDGFSPWQVAIRDPNGKNRILGTVELFDRGTATSSWYEHCFYKDDVLYHHIINPVTGHPISLDLQSVTVLSSDAMYTDLISTAIFLLGEKDGAELVSKIKQEEGIDIDYVLHRKDGSIEATSGASFRPYAN